MVEFPSSPMRSFPQLIRYWRERKELSLAQAAAIVGITKAHLWELEQGRATNPTIRTLAGLANATGASLSHLARLAAKGALADAAKPSPKKRSVHPQEAHNQPSKEPHE